MTVKGYRRTVIVLTAVLLIVSLIVSDLATPYPFDKGADFDGSGRKLIALTFDDGPGKFTEELLDGLKERGAKASFFLMGRKIEKHPELVRRMYGEGHLVGNHTWSHPSFFTTPLADIQSELSETAALIESITGERPEYYRPPYGYYYGSLLKEIDSVAVLWSDTPRDWVNIDADYICDYLVENARDGAIMLLHDTKAATVPAVLRAIDILSEQGYKFVRVDELLCRNGDKLAAGLAYRFCADGKRTVYY